MAGVCATDEVCPCCCCVSACAALEAACDGVTGLEAAGVWLPLAGPLAFAVGVVLAAPFPLAGAWVLAPDAVVVTGWSPGLELAPEPDVETGTAPPPEVSGPAEAEPSPEPDVGTVAEAPPAPVDATGRLPDRAARVSLDNLLSARAFVLTVCAFGLTVCAAATPAVTHSSSTAAAVAPRH